MNTVSNTVPAHQGYDSSASAIASGLAQFSGGAAAVPTAIATRFDIGEYIRTILKWKLFVLAAIILTLVAALLYSYTRVPLFSATSQIIMQDNSSQMASKNDRAAPFVFNNPQFVATQLGLLKSVSQAKKVVTRARLAQNPAYANQASNAKDREEQAAQVVRSQLQVENVRDSRLINITVTTPSAAVSANLANVYAEEYITSNLERGMASTAYARDFLEKQLEINRQKLEDSERQLVGYATDKRIIELGMDKEGNASRSLDASSLVKLNEALSEARVERISAAQNMRHNNSAEKSAEGSGSQALRTQRAQLEAEYQQKSAIFLPEYPDMIALRERIKSLDRAIRSEQRDSTSSQAISLRGQYRAAVDKENELAKKVDKLKDDLLKLRNRSIEYTILQREVDTNRVLYEGLLQQYKGISLTDGVGKNDVTIVDKARIPGGPISPNIRLNVLMGLIAGVILGIGGAFLIEFAGDSINLPDEVERKLNLALLGVMPKSEKGVRVSDDASDPKSEISEAANSLRTALQFTTTHGAPRSILLTSSRPSEGKSSVSFALALAFSRLGKKVLLVDADMRRPTFYPGLDSRDSEQGLSNVLTGQLNGDLPVRSTGTPNLSLMVAGPTVPNPADLLSTNAYSEMLRRAHMQFDVVIADGPPVLGLADALLLGAQSEAVIMIVEASAIRRSQVVTALNRLRTTNAHIVGAVLNKFSRSGVGYGYGYHYEYNYGHAASSDNAADDERKIVLRET